MITLELRQTSIVVMVLLSRIKCLMLLLMVLNCNRCLAVTLPLDLVGFLCCLGGVDLLELVVLVVLMELASSY